MRERRRDVFTAATFAFLALACASAAVNALYNETAGLAHFVPAVTATAAIFAAFAVWMFFGIRG